MHKLVTGICILVLGAGVGATVFWLSVRDRLATVPVDPPPNEREPVATPAEPPRLSHTPEGETVIRFETETQERVGLKVEAVAAATRQPEVGAYGVLQEDPGQSFTMRAPIRRHASATSGFVVSIDRGTPQTPARARTTYVCSGTHTGRGTVMEEFASGGMASGKR